MFEYDDESCPRKLSLGETSDWIDTAAISALQGLLAGASDNLLTYDKTAFLADQYAMALWNERERHG